MRRELLPAAITGGYVTEYDLRLLEKSLSLQIEVLDNGVLSVYDVYLDRISHLDFKDKSANRWERIEITDFAIDDGPESSASEDWLVRFNFWDVAELAIRCAAIRVDGEVLR